MSNKTRTADSELIIKLGCPWYHVINSDFSNTHTHCSSLSAQTASLWISSRSQTYPGLCHL